MTLKGTIIFGALTIAAAMMFAGSQEDENALAEAKGEQSADSEEPSMLESIGIKREETQESPVEDDELAEDDQPSDWGEDTLIDNTEGFDPTPAGDSGPSLGQPMDDTVNQSDAGDVYVEVQDRPIAGSRLDIPSTAKRPSN